MQTCKGRSAGYMAGSMMIVASTVISLVGVACPGWLKFHTHVTSKNNVSRAGLFLECSSHKASCRGMSLMEVQGYEMWSHVIISMGILALCVSSCCVAIFNCCPPMAASRLQLVEGFAIYGGFFIVIGVVNYTANDRQRAVSSYSYAFFLTVLSSLAALTGGAAVALANRKSRDLDHPMDGAKTVEEEKEEEKAMVGVGVESPAPEKEAVDIEETCLL